MRSARSWAAMGAAGLAVSATAAALGAPAATAAGGSHHATMHKRVTPAIARSHPAGKVAAHSRISFELVLSLRHAHKAAATVRKVSYPSSARYHHYLTQAQWRHRFSPSHAQVSAAKHWLHKRGLVADSVSSTRMFVRAHGTAKRVDKAFSTQVGLYRVNGHTVRLANSKLSLPTRLAGKVSGVVGVNQYLRQPGIVRAGSASVRPNAAEPPPPDGFRNPQPCSAYWGQKVDTADSPSLYAPYTAHRPYDICGYKPGQLRSAYQTQGAVSHGTNGSGVTIAIVDAYDSPTLLKDAQKYAALNDPGYPLKSSQFTNHNPGSVINADLCDGSGWYGEQSLDVEAAHGMAPGAHLLYVGAKDCNDDSFLDAELTAVTSGASVVSNSWGGSVGDLLNDQDLKTAYDDIFSMAASTGVSVLFSSGDDGDNFADFGIASPDYPASSPLVTAVGGTTLKVTKTGARNGEFGWSTGKQVLCAGVPNPTCGSARTPAAPLAFNSGSGGGTSYTYLQPRYQAGVVPTALATRNSALFGDTKTRVIPDISMDGDAQSGMLIGTTQTFSDGAYYDQYKVGGTSLASPLLAGIIADADQAAGHSLGFANPALYNAYKTKPGAIKDILPVSSPKSAATIRVDYDNTVDQTDGYDVSLRVLDYEGPETYCDGTGNCATRNVTLKVAHGFDAMTGLGVVGPSFISQLAKY